MNVYKIVKLINHDIVLFEGNKQELINYINSTNEVYQVGNRTPLHKIAYVLQPDYKLFRNGKEVYTI